MASILYRTSSEYRSWFAMRNRCLNKNSEKYPIYGGRGITICDRWKSFDNFLEDMGNKPTLKHSLDRIDNDGNYEPDNCRWATPQEQAVNRGKQRNNTSGVTGVGYYKPYSKWRARIQRNGKIKHLGYYDSSELAQMAYEKALTT